MVSQFLGELCDAVGKRECVYEVLERKLPLESPYTLPFDQLPVGNLRMEMGDLLFSSASDPP